jgi:hypothetical protein
MWPVPDRRRNNTPERVFKPAGRAREDDHDHHPRRVRRAGVGHARMRRTVVITTPRFLAVPSLVARVVKDKEPGQQSSRKPIWGKRRLPRRRKSNPRYRALGKRPAHRARTLLRDGRTSAAAVNSLLRERRSRASRHASRVAKLCVEFLTLPRLRRVDRVGAVRTPFYRTTHRMY